MEAPVTRAETDKSVHKTDTFTEDAPTLEKRRSSDNVPIPPGGCGKGRKLSIEGLGILDKLLPVLIFIAMVIGIVVGKFSDNTHVIMEGATFHGVSVPIVIGLLVMMWPILTKVQYERFPHIFRARAVWRQIAVSLLLNWVVAPFVMLALAFATLPDQPTYRTGVILVGLARCIAMVMIWNTVAQGDTDLCAILVMINSALQIVLYSPLSLLFVNVIQRDHTMRLEYGRTAIDVLIYLGIPLVAGIITRFGVIALIGRKRFETVFLAWFGPLALLGLLYTIIVICMQQATRFLDNIGLVFRVMVPMALYFALMWILTFGVLWRLSRRPGLEITYQNATVQAFTAASNNFELAIAICVAIYGVGSDQALAACVGPLVEVPVLLGLSYVALYLRARLAWGPPTAAKGGV